MILPRWCLLLLLIGWTSSAYTDGYLAYREWTGRENPHAPNTTAFWQWQHGFEASRYRWVNTPHKPGWMPQ